MKRLQWADVGVLVVSAVLLVALCSPGYESRSFWFDEAETVRMARLPLMPHVSQLLAGDFHSQYFFFLQLLYFVGMHFWIQAVPLSELTLRVPSTVAAVLCLPAMLWLARRLFDERCARYAVVLLATSMVCIHYAQEARCYTLLLLLLLVGARLFWRALDEPAPASWACWVVAALLAFYTHAYAALVILAQSVYVLVDPARRGRHLRALLLADTAILGGSLLALRVLRSGGTEALNWADRPVTLTDVFHLLHAWANGSNVVLAMAAVVVAAGVWSLRRACNDSLAFVGLWLVLPLLLVFVGSVSLTRLWVPRYLIVAFPAWILLLSACLCQLRPRRCAPLLVLLMLVASFPVWRDWALDNPGRDPWREVATLIRAQQREDDAFTFLPWTMHEPFALYRFDLAPGHHYVREDEPDRPVAPRIWVIESNGDDDPPAEVKQRYRDYRLTEHARVPALGSSRPIQVWLYER